MKGVSIYIIVTVHEPSNLEHLLKIIRNVYSIASGIVRVLPSHCLSYRCIVLMLHFLTQIIVDAVLKGDQKQLFVQIKTTIKV